MSRTFTREQYNAMLTRKAIEARGRAWREQQARPKPTYALEAPAIWTDPTIRHMSYVYSRQDVDEQEDKTTKVKNHRGFTAVDASVCSSILDYVMRHQRITEKQLGLLRMKAEKYTRQRPDEEFDTEEFRTEWLTRNAVPEPTEPIPDRYLFEDEE